MSSPELRPPHRLKLGLGAHSCSRSTAGSRGQAHSRHLALPGAGFPHRWPVPGLASHSGPQALPSRLPRSIQTTPHTRCPLLPARCPTAVGPRAHNPVPPAPSLLRDRSRPPTPPQSRRGVAAPTDPLQKPTPCFAPLPQRSLQPRARSDLRNRSARLVPTSERSRESANPQPRGYYKQNTRRAACTSSARAEGADSSVHWVFKSFRADTESDPRGSVEGASRSGDLPSSPPGRTAGLWRPVSPNPLRVSVAHPLTDARPPGSNPLRTPRRDPENAVTVQAQHPLRTDSGLLRHRRPAPVRSPRPPPPGYPRSRARVRKEKEQLSWRYSRFLRPPGEPEGGWGQLASVLCAPSRECLIFIIIPSAALVKPAIALPGSPLPLALGLSSRPLLSLFPSLGSASPAPLPLPGSAIPGLASGGALLCRGAGGPHPRPDLGPLLQPLIRKYWRVGAEELLVFLTLGFAGTGWDSGVREKERGTL